MIRSPVITGIRGPRRALRHMKKIIPLVAISAISLPAMAAETDAFYASLGAGMYRLDSGAFDETAPSMKILGGYNFTENVALEASYTRLFEASEMIEDTRVDIDGNVWDLSTKLSYPLGNRFSPYGRLGWSYVDLSAFAQDQDTSIRLNDYDNAFTWALGASFKVNDRFDIAGEHARSMINEGDLDFVSVNLNYRFGAQ